MGLSIVFNDDDVVCDTTHNLVPMAKACGMYEYVWQADEILGEDFLAKDIAGWLEYGLLDLLKNKAKCKEYNSPNGWGTYEDFVQFLTTYIAACHERPDATVYLCR